MSHQQPVVTLSDIAAGLEVTVEQCDRGVATVDDTGGDLATRLTPYADELPCEPATAATLVESYTGGRSIGECARRAGLPAVAAAKTLHLLGVDGVCPLSAQGRQILRDWLAGDLSRTEARLLAGAGEREFALATFVETHDPLAGAMEAVEGELTPDDAEDALVDARSDLDEFV